LKLKKTILLYLLLIFLTVAGYTNTIASFKNLNNPESITVHKQRIYIVDGSEVKVFSLDDFRPLFKFGRRGVGPGELFRNEDYNIQLQIRGRHIYLNSRNKIIQYSMAGKVLNETTFRMLSWQIIPLEDYFAMVIFGTTAGQNRILNLKMVDSASSPTKILYSYEFPNPNKTREFLLVPNLLLVRPYRDKLFVFDRKNGFPMMVFDLNGKLIDKINHRPQNRID
jgi:hypothetical protein